MIIFFFRIFYCWIVSMTYSTIEMYYMSIKNLEKCYLRNYIFIRAYKLLIKSNEDFVITIIIKFSSNLLARINQTLFSEGTIYILEGGCIRANAYAFIAICHIFSAPSRRPRRIRSQMRRRRAERWYDLGNKRRPPGIRTRVRARTTRHPVYNKVVAHIAPVSLFLLLYVPIVRIELHGNSTRTCIRTRVRRELLLRRRVSIRQIARVETPPPSRCDRRPPCLILREDRPTGTAGKFSFFFLLFFFLNLSLSLSLYSSSPFALRAAYLW